MSLIYVRNSLFLPAVPPRLSSQQTLVRLQEGQEGFVLQCNKDVGDDPISYRWLKVGTGCGVMSEAHFPDTKIGQVYG